MVVPWGKIVSLHKEIARRAEDSFFSLPLSNSPSKRWASLTNFSLDQFAGPWSLDAGSIHNEELLRDFLVGDTRELFLGGPCYLRKKNRVLYWQPILYRAVKITAEEGDFSILPDQGSWDVSPVLHDYLDYKSVVLDRSLEDLMRATIEETQRLAIEQNENLATLFRRVIAEHIPDLADLVSPRHGGHVDSGEPLNWVLFAPREANFSQGLVKDYGQLEKVLNREPGEAHGLNLLVPGEVSAPTNNVEVDLHAFFPLNESQQAAVKSIMQNRVSVISGPPGCGKSQVVLSALMNCWARGETVLFASNNNKAVDVVRDRLRTFQYDFPISVRTGNREVSELYDTIAKMRAHIAHGPGDMTDESSRQIERLKCDKERYCALLETGTPQIIQENLRASLGAYGKYQSARAELEECIAHYRKELYALGYDCEPETFSDNVLKPLSQWLNEVEVVKTNIDGNQLALMQLQERQKQLQNKRDDLLNELGGDARRISHWEWLIEEGPMKSQKAWFQEMTDFLSGSLEEQIRPFHWEKEYSFWEGADEAQSWARSARQLLGDLNNVLAEYQSRMDEWEKLWMRHDEVKAEANRLGIYVLEAGVREDATQWIDAYTVFITYGGRLKWLPLSEHNKAIRAMRRIESTLRGRFSVAAWRQVGALDRDGRIKLCATLEAVMAWDSAQREWEATADDRSRAVSAFNDIRSKMLVLRLKDVPLGVRTNDWGNVAADLERRILCADAAVNAHTLRCAFNACKEKGESLCGRFFSLNCGLPLHDFWMDKYGGEWNPILKEASENFGPSSVASLRRLLHGGTMRVLLSTWQEMRDSQLALQEVNQEIQTLPTKKMLIAQWWAKHPPLKQGLLILQNELPSPEHVLFRHFQDCNSWQEKWNAFIVNELSVKQNTIRLEFERAQAFLKEAAARIADTDLCDSFPQSITRLLEGKTAEWPVEDIQRWLESYGPDRIRARIKGLEADLATGLFRQIRAAKIRELAADAQVLGALAALQNHANLYGEEYASNFKAVLRALPVWITTALSTRDIPMLPALFDLLIIDEATQCSVTNILPLLYRAKRVAVIGDIEQLPAIDNIKSGAQHALAERFGVTQWLSEYGHAGNNIYKCAVRALPRSDVDVLFLIDHYRSHPLIIGFSNQYLYKQRLRLRRDPSQTLDVDYSGLHVLRVVGYCERDPHTGSWINKEEARAVCELIGKLRNIPEYTRLSIGVVTPFWAQAAHIIQLLGQMQLAQWVTVGTVHKFQGDERDIMLFSPVVSRGIAPSTAKWVESPSNLVNVAITRAREGLIFVGDTGACRLQDGILGELARYVENVELLRRTSLDELELYSWMIMAGWCPEIHVPIGDIEVDFVLSNPATGVKLVVEVDGRQHQNTIAQDAARDAFLMAQGYAVLRFSTQDVRETPQRIIDIIRNRYSAE